MSRTLDLNVNLSPGQNEPTAAVIEQARMWRVEWLDDVELLHARYRTQRFRRHFHEGYAFGVIETGALGFHYRNRDVVAQAGDINLAIPGEPHDGHAVGDQGWGYRMFYLGADLVRNVAEEVTGRSQGLPFFAPGRIHDPPLAARLHDFHRLLGQPDVALLEAQSRLLAMVAALIEDHGQTAGLRVRLGAETAAVRRVRDHIEAHFDQSISLETLAAVAGLSRYHLLRVFHRQVGLPPHAYQTMVRVARAKDLLAKGLTPADVSQLTGFFDQSHLNRHFKAIHGVTPGAFRNIVQDRPALPC